MRRKGRETHPIPGARAPHRKHKQCCRIDAPFAAALPGRKDSKIAATEPGVPPYRL